MHGFEQRLKSFKNLDEQQSIVCVASQSPVLKHKAMESMISVNQKNTNSTKNVTRSDQESLAWTALALCGWEASNFSPGGGCIIHDKHKQAVASMSPSSSYTIFCQMCNRKVGIWNFVQRRKGETLQNDETNTKPKSTRNSSNDTNKILPHLDPVNEHRWFCPWITSQSIISEVGQEHHQVAGWERVAHAFVQAQFSQHDAQELSTVGGSVIRSELKNHEQVVQRSNEVLQLLQSGLLA